MDKVYTVLHEDSLLGLIEKPVTIFLEVSDVPFHRIQLFKCDGEIIWDRKNKFSLVWKTIFSIDNNLLTYQSTVVIFKVTLTNFLLIKLIAFEIRLTEAKIITW